MEGNDQLNEIALCCAPKESGCLSVAKPISICYKSFVKLTTHQARELYLYGPPGGDRIVDVNELVRHSGASRRAISEHLPKWREESLQLAQNRTNQLPAFALRDQAFMDHRRDVEFLRLEVDRIKSHLRSLSPADPTYLAVNRALLSTERQWAKMSGVQAAIDAMAARMKEQEKKREEIPNTIPVEAEQSGAGVFRLK